MATTLNLYIDQNSDFRETVSVTNDAGELRDLSNCNAYAQLRKTYATVSNVEFDISINNPDEGEIILEIPAATTANIKSGRYVYDMILVGEDTIREKIVEGIVTVYPSSTRF